MTPRSLVTVITALHTIGLAEAVLRTCPDIRDGPTVAEFGSGPDGLLTNGGGEPISGIATPEGGDVTENTVVLTTCDFMYPNTSYADSGVPCGEPNAPAADEASCDMADEISFFSTKYTEAEIEALRDQINDPILIRGMRVSEALLNDSLPGVTDVLSPTTANITFLTEGACQENAVGMFTFWTAEFLPTEDWVRGDGNRALLLDRMNVSIIFPTVDDLFCNRLGEDECNLSDENQDLCSNTKPNLKPGTTVRLKPDFRSDDSNYIFPAGISFGFFIVPHASSPTHRIRQDGFGNGEEPVDTPEAPPADLTHVLFSVPALQSPALQNAGLGQHSVQYIPPPDVFFDIFGDVLIYSFEDVRRDIDRSNEDFDDVVIMVEIDLEDTALLSEAPSLAPTRLPTAPTDPSVGLDTPSAAPTVCPTKPVKSKKKKKKTKKAQGKILKKIIKRLKKAKKKLSSKKGHRLLRDGSADAEKPIDSIEDAHRVLHGKGKSKKKASRTKTPTKAPETDPCQDDDDDDDDDDECGEWDGGRRLEEPDAEEEEDDPEDLEDLASLQNLDDILAEVEEQGVALEADVFMPAT